MSLKIGRLLSVALLLSGAHCEKIPLTSEFGVIDLAIAHWFENEGVVYVFYSLAERESRLTQPAFTMTATLKSESGGGEESVNFNLNDGQGVHQHRLVPCGADRICGSYSFKSRKALTGGTLKFQYHGDSPLGLSKPLSVQNHFDRDQTSRFSAQFYGVFDSANERLQVRMVHNFGVPGSAEVGLYGLGRKFRVFGAQLENINLVDYKEAKSKTGSNLAFPAAFCKTVSGASGPYDLILEQESAWYQELFAATNLASGACFSVEYLGKNNQTLLNAPVPAAGLRNPVARDATSFSLTNLLKEVLQIPLVIKICEDDPARNAMVDQDFFTYQRYVLGFSDAVEDICFKIGKSEEFRERLETVLSAKLAAIKNLPNPESRDYFFAVVLHEKFSLEFRDIQSKIAESISKIASLESEFVSPRLIGALVYASSVNFVPSVEQQKYIVWCPQNLLDNVLAGPTAALGKENCTITPQFNLDLRIINFVAPLGPLPSLASYQSYVKEFGDSGIARNPKLKIFSVPQTNLTIVDDDKRVSYFDSQRYVVGPGEKARICNNRLQPGMSDILFKPFNQDLSLEGISLFDINSLWLADADAGVGEYRIGISWRYGFWGGISYQGALNGKVASVIPYTRSISSYEELGDSKWSQERINLGQAIQHCFAYCSHPYFDDAGQYQVNAAWDELRRSDCTTPKIPQWNGS